MAVLPPSTKGRPAPEWQGLIIAALLVACGREAPPVAKVTPRKPPAPAHESRTRKSSDADFDKAMPAAEKEPTPEEIALRRQVDDILDQYPQMNAKDLLGVPEVRESLGDFFKQLGQSPDLQNRINSSIAYAAAMKDLRGPKESLDFSMDVTGYDKDTTRQMLTSLLSRDASRVVGFFEKQVSDASAEFALDPGTPKSNNGISVSPKPAAP